MIARILHIILLAVLFVQYSYAQQPFTKDIWLNETNTDVKVNCIEQDSAGFLWLGTENGLYRYDGYEFEKSSTGGNNNITALSISNNIVWVGFNNGTIGFYQKNKFYEKPLNGDSIKTAISSIHVMQGQTIIVSTYGQGLFFIHNSYATRYGRSKGLSDEYIYTATIPGNKNILIATDRGINEIGFKKDILKIKKYTTTTGLPDNIVRSIKPMRKKCWSWVGTQQGGLALYCKMLNTIWSPKNETSWKWGSINDILPLEDGHALICTDQGYLIDATLIDSNHVKTTPFHYPNRKFNKIIEDNTGNIWIATNKGLMLSTYTFMKKTAISAPYSLQALTSIVANDKYVWLAMGNNLYRYNLTTNTKHKTFTSKVSISNLHLDDNNTLWIGTFGDGLWHKNIHSNAQKIKHIPLLNKESILDIAHSNDRLWVAGLNGIEELSLSSSAAKIKLHKLHNKNTGVGSDYVYQICTDNNGGVWMATDGAGVCMYNNGKYTHWDSSQGMVSKVTYSIIEDTSGNIWATTLNKGLIKFDGEKWTQYNRNHGIQDVNISAITSSTNGQVYITNTKGIDIWQPHSQQFRSINKRMRLGIDSLSDVLKLITQNSTNIFIPYQDGLIAFSPTNQNQNIIPSIRITGISTFFVPTPLDKKEFSYSNNHITFNFKGINLVNTEPLFYRYQLKGYNDMWIETKDRSVTFPKLPSGNYTFCVQTSTNNSFNIYSEDTKEFYIGKPIWLQLWFIILAICIAWGIAYAYVKTKERNLRKVSSLQKERMLFEYEHLKSQVNPHFLFNSLNTLTSLIENEDDAALKYTNELSDLYRNMLSHRNKDTISLADEWEIMNNYLYIQKSRFGNALQLKADVDETTRLSKRVVPMALQLLLENAIKHNIVSMHQPLIINISTKASSLIVRNTYQPKMSKEKGAGLGLANIRKRYSLLTKKRVISGIENDEFVVVIPLL